MNLGITVIVLCLAPIVWGQILNQSGDTLQVQGKAILDLQLRLSTVERLRNEDALRIADLQKRQQIYQRRIANLEKEQQIHRDHISDLENKRDEDNRTITDLEQKQQKDHILIADLEKKQHYDMQRIPNLEKRQRVADLEKKLKDGDQRRLTFPQKHQYRRKLDSHRKFPFNSFTNNTTRLVDERLKSKSFRTFPRYSESTGSAFERHMPRVRNTRGLELNPRNSELPCPAFENSDQGIKEKRVSPDNEGKVAFYAVLSHTINPVANLMEIRFDRVLTNIGGSYSGNTGTFTCTNAGVYVFSWTAHENPLYMYTELVKNGAMIGSAFSGHSVHDGIGGGTVIVQLDQGDEIWVRVERHPSGTHIYVDQQKRFTTMFSGFLLWNYQ